MDIPQVVIDTNVIVSALRSLAGASHLLVSRLGCGLFEANVTMALEYEYVDACYRQLATLPLTQQEIDDYLADVFRAVNRHRVYFRWGPFLPDPKDDKVLEAAVASGSGVIVTHNRRDFRGASQFGVQVLLPADFLRSLGGVP